MGGRLLRGLLQGLAGELGVRAFGTPRALRDGRKAACGVVDGSGRRNSHLWRVGEGLLWGKRDGSCVWGPKGLTVVKCAVAGLGKLEAATRAGSGRLTYLALSVWGRNGRGKPAGRGNATLVLRRERAVVQAGDVGVE